jgi:hypothetical protein
MISRMVGGSPFGKSMIGLLEFASGMHSIQHDGTSTFSPHPAHEPADERCDQQQNDTDSRQQYQGQSHVGKVAGSERNSTRVTCWQLAI